uniref:Kringle domain-containing protein n=1 Tax=Alexandrium catenella TaxID=2925 RepID=A0A7S1WJR0_ALECA
MPRLLLPALLATLGRAHGLDDETALLQTSSVSVAESCKCLNWKEAYGSSKVECGAGLELTDKELKTHPDNELCHEVAEKPGLSFFLNADHGYCMIAEKVEGPQKKDYPGSWCYVDSSCQQRNGGKAVNDAVSYKMCQDGAGETLGELPPRDLFALSERLFKQGAVSDSEKLTLMAYDWAGPPAAEGSLLDVKYDASAKPLIGAGRVEDVFVVVYKDEVWEVHDGPVGECKHGCSGKTS